MSISRRFNDVTGVLQGLGPFQEISVAFLNLLERYKGFHGVSREFQEVSVALKGTSKGFRGDSGRFRCVAGVLKAFVSWSFRGVPEALGVLHEVSRVFQWVFQLLSGS